MWVWVREVRRSDPNDSATGSCSVSVSRKSRRRGFTASMFGSSKTSSVVMRGKDFRRVMMPLWRAASLMLGWFRINACVTHIGKGALQPLLLLPPRRARSKASVMRTSSSGRLLSRSRGRDTAWPMTVRSGRREPIFCPTLVGRTWRVQAGKLSISRRSALPGHFRLRTLGGAPRSNLKQMEKKQFKLLELHKIIIYS